MNPEVKTPSLEFEDNWRKPTDTKAPEKPVDIPPPGEEKKKTFDQPTTETQVSAATDVKPKKENLSASLSGEFTTDGINFIQSLVFKLVNKRKIIRRIGKDNIERFGELLEELIENKKKPEGLEPKDLRLFLQFRRLMQVQEDIPFDDDEYDKISNAWTKYYEETGKGLPPWFGLMIAMADTIGARLADAFTE